MKHRRFVGQRLRALRSDHGMKQGELAARLGISVSYLSQLEHDDRPLTATLEAALFKRPMVIAYKISGLSWQIMKHMAYLPWVGLPNILCRDFVVPELIQDAATPQALCAAALQWLDARRHNPQKIANLEQRFTALHESLLRDTPKLAAHAIQKILHSAA